MASDGKEDLLESVKSRIMNDGFAAERKRNSLTLRRRVEGAVHLFAVTTERANGKFYFALRASVIWDDITNLAVYDRFIRTNISYLECNGIYESSNYYDNPIYIQKNDDISTAENRIIKFYKEKAIAFFKYLENPMNCFNNFKNIDKYALSVCLTPADSAKIAFSINVFCNIMEISLLLKEIDVNLDRFYDEKNNLSKNEFNKYLDLIIRDFPQYFSK